MSTSILVDRETLTDATDFAALARDVLREGGGYGSLPSDNAPLDWILRAFEAVKGSPLEDPLTRGVAACLTDPEPSVRSQALIFFQSRPRAAGAEQIETLVAGDRALFAGVPDPWHPSVDLEWGLLDCLSARVDQGEKRAADLARAVALEPGKGAPVVGALTSVDPDWVIAHADQVVRRSDDGLIGAISILNQLERDGRAELVALGRRFAQLFRGDTRFETDLTQCIDDPEARRQILDAFHGK